MKLKYLGTAAAEGVPAPFCHCKVCDYARAHRGKEIRTRQQAIIDGDLLLDFGPDTYMHSIVHDLDLAAVHSCLITHTHGDHLYAEEFDDRNPVCAIYDTEIPPLYVYGGSGVEKALHPDENGMVIRDNRVIFKKVSAFEPFEAGEYRITPLPALHSTEEPLIYLIEKDGKRILYAHDTDVFFEEVWTYLRENKIVLDLASLDCTEGVKHIDYQGHMNFERDAQVRERMLREGIADEHTIFVTTHYSHNGLATYQDAVNSPLSEGFVIAYDGMEIDV